MRKADKKTKTNRRIYNNNSYLFSKMTLISEKNYEKSSKQIVSHIIK